MDVANTIIRSYERDIKAGIPSSLIRRHARNRVRHFRKNAKWETAAKIDQWLNTTL